MRTFAIVIVLLATAGAAPAAEINAFIDQLVKAYEQAGASHVAA